MAHPSGSAPGRFTKYLHFSLLHTIYISSFYYSFVGARPALPNQVSCKQHPIEGAIYILDEDNHLVQRFLGIGCHLIPKQNIVHRDELGNSENEILASSIEDIVPVIGTDSGCGSKEASVPSISSHYSIRGGAKEVDFLGPEKKLPNTEGHLLQLQQANHHNKPEDSNMHQLPVTGNENQPSRLGYNTGEEYHLLSTENLYQWQVVRRDEVDKELLIERDSHLILEESGAQNEAKAALVLNSKNQLVPLQLATRRIKAKEEDWEKEISVFWDDLLGKKAPGRPETQTTPTLPAPPVIPKSRPYHSSTTQDIGSYSAMLGSNDGIIASYSPVMVTPTAHLGLANDITTNSYTWSVNIPDFVWPTTMTESTDVAEQTLGQKLMSGDSNNSVVAPNQTLHVVSPLGYHNRSSAFPSDFNRVAGMAIGLGFLMAFPSLILMCALSKKAQFIWIRTVKVTSVQPPVAEHGYFDGESNIIANDTSGVSPRDDTQRSDTVHIHDIDSINRSGIVPNEGINYSSRLETIPHLEAPNRLGTASRHDTESADRSGVTPRHDTGSVNRSGGFQNPTGRSNNMKKPGFFKRLFGWDSAKHVSFEETISHTSTGQGRKINSISRDGAPDPSLILTEVAERLIRERMRQLSTVHRVREEEGALPNITHAHEGESSLVSSDTAVSTGSVMGAHVRDSTSKRSRQGILKPFGNIDGVGVSAGYTIADGNNSTREESQGEEPEGNEGSDSRGVAPRLVRFDDSVDKAQQKARGTLGRVSIRNYLFPTVEDDNTSTGEVSSSEKDIFEMSSGTVIRKEGGGERANGLWGKIFGDSVTVSADSTISGGTGAELERQPKKGCEFEDSRTGSSTGGGSTLTVNSSDGVELVVDSRLPMEEGYRPESGEAVHSSGFGIDTDLVSSQLVGAQSAMDAVAEGVVNAFGTKGKSPRWDSSDDSQLSSGYFTESGSSQENMMGEARFDTSTLVGYKEDED